MSHRKLAKTGVEEAIGFAVTARVATDEARALPLAQHCPTE